MKQSNVGASAFMSVSCAALLVGVVAAPALGHGTVTSPVSRVYRVRLSNPESPDFPLAVNAVNMDGKDSYYTWNEVSRNIPEAVGAGLPAGFDYSPWIPDGQLASAGRTEIGDGIPRTYKGLDQASSDWPTTPIDAGQTLEVDFLVTAAHSPSVWDVWMTTQGWDPGTALNWGEMEFLGRPATPPLEGEHYFFDIDIPADRSGHHVLWVAWQRDDPAGEVFISASDVMVQAVPEPGVLGLVLLGGGLLVGRRGGVLRGVMGD